jgi:multiple sugar transport system permease protein
MIPIFVLARTLGLIDTIPGLVLFDVPLILPFAVLILHDAFRQVPPELEEAALVDGGSWWRILWQITLPLSWPAVLAAATICFAFAWNEFPFALTFYQQNLPTMPLVVSSLETKDGIEMGYVGVNLVVALLPPVCLSLLAQRYIVRGLTFGTVKG